MSLQYPPPPPELQKGFSLRLLRYFGAGAIIASVTIGSGETVFASRAGAIFGYGLLWAFMAAVLMKGVQVYTAARYITLTGEHPMTAWGRLPGPRNWVPLTIGILSLLCFPFWLSGLPLLLGGTLNWIFKTDLDPRLWGTAAILISVTATWLQTYKVLEVAQTAIVAILLLSLLAACAASRPDLGSAAAGLVPSVPHYPSWFVAGYPKEAANPEWVLLVASFGAIGGGTYDYLGYIGCLREHRWGLMGAGAGPIDPSEENVRRGRTWLRAPLVDVGVGFASVLIFTLCFILLGAVVLHPKLEVPTSDTGLLSSQAQFLTQFSPALERLYQVGIFFAIYGTVYGAYEVYTRTAYECLAPISGRIREMPARRFKAWILTYCAAAGLAMLWFMSRDPLKMVEPAAIVGGVFTCGLWCFAMVWADRKFLPAPLRMGPGLLTATLVSGLVMTGIGIPAIWLKWKAFFP